MSAVYFARLGETGPVKIGYTRSHAVRLDSISARLWDDLHLIRLLSGEMRHEKQMHERFLFCRIRGEWFRFHPAMMEDLGLPDLLSDLDKVLPRFSRNWSNRDPERGRWAATLRDWMIAQGLTEYALSRKLGCTGNTVDSWLRNGTRPYAITAERLMAIAEPTVIAALRESCAASAQRKQAAA